MLDSRGRDRSDSQTFNTEPSQTIQSDANAADIRHILSRHSEVGIVENLNQADAMFMDVSEFGDFADVVRQTKVAEVEFLKLPSKTREIFGHDVANWLDAAHDQEKRDALDLGKPTKVVEPVVPPASGGEAPPVVDGEPPSVS